MLKGVHITESTKRRSHHREYKETAFVYGQQGILKVVKSTSRYTYSYKQNIHPSCKYHFTDL